MNRDLKPSTGSCIRTCSAVRRSPCGLAEAGTSPSAGRAEEVVQELFAFAWEHQADLWSSASPTGWLYRVLRYKVLELLKEDRFWRKHLIRAAGEMPASPEDDFQQRAEITSILTPEEYEILRKLYLEKYTYEELAREMGLKKSALAMRVKRSKERFVKQWNRH